MSVETTTRMFVNVPVKLLAGRVLKAIRDDQSVIEIELTETQHSKVALHCDGEFVFTEPGE